MNLYIRIAILILVCCWHPAQAQYPSYYSSLTAHPFATFEAISMNESQGILWGGYFDSLVNFNVYGLDVDSPLQANSKCGFVTRLRSNQSYAWTARYKAPRLAHVQHINAQPDNTFIIGRFRDSMDIDPGPNTQMIYASYVYIGDYFITCIDSNRSFLWGKSWHMPSVNNYGFFTIDQALRDRQGNIYLIGNGTHGSDMDPGTGVHWLEPSNPNINTLTSFIAKLDPQGNLLWAKKNWIWNGNFGGKAGIALDTASNLIVYGTNNTNQVGDVNPGPNNDPILPNGSFLVKLAPSGNYLWGLVNNTVRGIQTLVVDRFNNMVLTGVIDGAANMDWKGGNQIILATNDRYIAKLEYDGDYVFGRKIPSKLTVEQLCLLATDTVGNIFLSGNGEATDTIDFDLALPAQFEYQSAASRDYYLAAYGPNGNYLWARQFANFNLGDLVLGVGVLNGKLTNAGRSTALINIDPGPTVHLAGNYPRAQFIQTLCLGPGQKINAFVCDSIVSPSGNYVYKSAGLYWDKKPNTSGCDSVFIITVEKPFVDTSIVRFGNVLHANAGAPATYQWLTCNPYLAISGANAQNYTTTGIGSYAVVVTVNGCTDTSGCIAMSPSGMESISPIATLLVFPNPTKNQVQLKADKDIGSSLLTLQSITGQILLQQSWNGREVVTLPIEGAAGIYILDIKNERFTQSIRLVKE